MAVGVSYGGQNVTGDTRALFLKVFSGEVINAYEQAIKVSPRLTTRTITTGKSAQFPTTGLALARYHQAGESLLGVETGGGSDVSGDSNAYLSTIKQSERVIFIDNLLTASCFIDQLDEAMTHYDYRSAFATELGRSLARHQDNYAIHMLYASATNANAVSNEHTPGANTAAITETAFYTNAAAAVDVLYTASQKLDEKDVPREDRFVVMPPIAYYNLLKAGVLSIDMHATSDTRSHFAETTPTAGVRGEPSGVRVAGMPIVVTNGSGFTSADGAADGAFTVDSKHPSPGNVEDFGMRNLGAAPDGTEGGTALAQTELMALVCHKDAAGIVKLKDITMESDYMVERQGTLMVAKLAQGMGALRNDACIAIIDT